MKGKQPERGRLKGRRSATQGKALPREIAKQLQKYNQAAKDFSYKYAKSARSLKGIFRFGYVTTKDEIRIIKAMIAECDNIIREGRLTIDMVNKKGLATGSRSRIKVIERGIKTARAFRNHYSKVKSAWETIEPGIRISEIKTIPKNVAEPHIIKQLKSFASAVKELDRDFDQCLRAAREISKKPYASQLEKEEVGRALVKASNEFINQGRMTIERIREFGNEEQYRDMIETIKEYIGRVETFRNIWKEFLEG